MDARKKKILEELKKQKTPRNILERYESMLKHRKGSGPSSSSSKAENPVPSTSNQTTSAASAASANPSASKEEKLRRKRNNHDLQQISNEEEAPNIFPKDPEEENIFKNKDFELVVQEKTLKNSSVFDISNHVCTIKVVKKKKNKILLADVSEILQNELTKIIVRIQSEYPDKDYRRQVYVTIVDKPNISTGINTRNYSLHENASKIASASIRHLENFLVSHKNMYLENAFHIDIKTLGLPNVKHRVMKKGNLKIHIPEEDTSNSEISSEESAAESDDEQPIPGSSNQSNPGTRVKTGYIPNPFSKERWKFHIPSGYSEKKNIFANYCLIIATIIGVYYQRQLPIIKPFRNSDYILHHKYKQKWKVISKINSNNKKQNSLAGEELLSILENILKKTSIKKKGPYEASQVIPILSEFFKVNIIIHSERVDRNGITYFYPEQINETFPTVRLFQEMVKKSPDVDHMSAILNPLRFKAKFHLECPICHKTFSGHRKAHKCLQRFETCYTCNRHYREKHMYINKQNNEEYCDSRLNVYVHESCPSCEKLFFSTNCKKYHVAYECLKGFVCKLCKKFVRQNDFISIEEARDSHICDDAKFCYICFERYTCTQNSSTHLCSMSPILPQVFHANLGFINMITYENLVTEGETETIPVLFDVSYEIRRFTFAYFQLSDKKFGFNDNDHFNDRFLSFKYLSGTTLLDTYYSTLSTSYGKRSKTATAKHSDKERIKLKLEFIVNYSICERLILSIIKPKFQSYTFIVQDQELLYFIFSSLIKLHIYPHSCNSDGTDMIYLTVKEYNITFVCYKNYLDFDIGTLKDMFYLNDIQYPLFPSQRFIFRDNFPDTSTNLDCFPAFENFLEYTDTATITNHKQKAYVTESRFRQSYHVTQNMLNSAKNKMKISVTAMLSFLKQLFQIQSDLHLQFPGKLAAAVSRKDKPIPMFSPFTTPIYTLASFNYTLFRYFGLNSQLYAIRNDFGSWVYNCSPNELEFILWHTHELRTQKKPVYSAFSPEGIKRLCNLIPDVASDNFAAWFHGCAVHAHFPCPNNPDSKKETTTNPWGKTHIELQQKWDNDMSVIKKRFPTFTFLIVWECEWNKIKQDNPKIGSFLREENLRPKKRMVPRDAMKNAITQVYAHYYDPKNFNDEMIIEDAVSCYPTEMLKQIFPIDKYITVIGQDLDLFKVENGKCYFQGRQCWGIAQVKFLVGENLKHPFMPVTVGSNTVLANCYRCVSTKSISTCNHSESERAFIETMTLADLVYLVEIGYVIKKIFEANLYFKADYIFHEYIKFTSSNKLRYTVPPKDVNIEQYCDRANYEMGLTGNTKLSPSDIQPNPNLRYVFKTMENSLFGKFSQGASKIKTKLIFSQSDLVNCFEKFKMTNFKAISNNVMQVWIKEKPKKIQRGTCSIISAYILSYARINMHRRIMTISSVGKVFHCSVDQLIYTIPKNEPSVFENLEIYGFMRNVYDGWKIEGYCAVTPYFYILLLSSNSESNQNPQFKTILKCRGIVSNTIESAPYFNFESIRNIVLQKFLNHYKISDSLCVPQTKRRKKSFDCGPGKQYYVVNLKTDVRNSRIINLQSNIYESYPLGYKISEDN